VPLRSSLSRGPVRALRRRAPQKIAGHRSFEHFLISVLYLLAVIIVSAVCSRPLRGVIILCAGDSLTDSEYPRKLQRLLGQEGRKAKVLNFGRKGHTSGEYLRFLRHQGAFMAREHPDFILIQLGTNDVRVDGDQTPTADFGRNIEAIISLFGEFTDRRGEQPRILLATIPPLPEAFTPPFGPGSRDRVTKEINPLIRKIAAAERLPLVDNYSLFLGAPEFLPDVHPTSEGYRLMARNWLETLRPLLPKMKD
jgi:lysophospholipase L1-like esterase